MPESYPIYRKNNHFFYKVHKKGESIMVDKGSLYNGILTSSEDIAFYGDSIESTVDEFADAYSYVRNKLDEIAL